MFYRSLDRQFINLTRVHAKLQVSAWCAFIQQSALIISKIEVARVGGSSLLQEAEQSSFSGRGRREPGSYAYLHLYQQCDALLLMGGVGVQHCNRPSFRKPFSHEWRGKRPLPVSFAHGRQLDVGCWKERYQKLRKGGSQRGGETMHCVNGEWFNRLQLPEMTGFSCKPCVAVASLGYGKYMEKQQQELYFFNRMGLRVFTELSPWGGAALKYCLQMAFDGGDRKNIRLKASHTCPEIVTMGVVGSGDVQERMMRVLKDGQPFEDSCLQAQPGQDDLSPSLQRQTCDLDQEQQLISPMAMPEILWSMHQEEDKRSNSLHKARSSFCGGHGALSSLSFGQIFGGMNSVPKSTCAFAPVIRFGQIRDTQITMDPRLDVWPEWNTLMANSPVLCEDGHALTSFHLAVARGIFVYECSQIAGLGATYEYFSAQVEVKGGFNQNRFSWSQAMRLIRADCGKSALLSGFHFEFSEGGRWARSKFTCAKAGGAPVVMEPATTVEDLYQAPEGIFCPHQSDFDTGRYLYKNKETGDTLNFEQDGSWCVGSDCSVPVGGATPVGVAMSTFEVVNVTDFDGHFEAKGVPSLGGGGMGDLMKSLKAIKPPKRPEQPPKPKLQDFKAEMPKYASECLDYQDLWTGVMETGQNSEGEEASEVAPLEADAGTLDAELPAYHPCDVMKNVGGIFGRLAGQSGKMAPANMLYNDWNECMTGDIERDFLAGKLDYGNALYHSIADVITEGVKLVCAIPPNVEVAPLGAGVEAAPSSICAEVTDFVRSIVNLPFDLGKGAMDLALETEGYAACNPFQVGFPRLFCDIHCVRDAVVRGDRTILRNLEKATKISNDNMRKMVEWSTEAARVESGYLDKKIDHSLKINTIYLHHIAKNTQPNGEELFQDAAHSTLAMLGELEGFAGASSFGVSRVTAVDALDRFVAAAQPLSAENTTERLGQVEMFQSQLSSLYQSMRTAAGSMTKAQVIGRQVAREAQQMQAHMRRQEQVLGIYRAHSHASHKAYKTWERSGAEATLVSLDALWWRLRGKLDSYLDAAGSEIETFKQSFKALAEYENCKAGTVDLLKSYRRSMRSMGKSHQHLRTAWRDASNLMGELASVISDGDVFGKFIAAEGCSSPLAAQTLDQTRLALQGTGFLLHRFQVAGLGKPDAGVLQEAAKRIHQAYASASSSCGAKNAKASGPLTHWAAAFRKSLSELFSRTFT